MEATGLSWIGIVTIMLVLLVAGFVLFLFRHRQQNVTCPAVHLRQMSPAQTGLSWLKDASEWLGVKLQPKGRRSHVVGRASRLRPTGADIIDMLTM